MRINRNIPALKALHQLTMNNSKLDKSLERLSSGLRINHASDDAAGLAITQKMNTQIRGLEQAKRNSMDGISLIQTAEGAMNEVHAMLQRMRELAVQASNGTYDSEDRKALQKEVDQLKDEIQRISDQIEFNEKKLLNGDIDQKAYVDDDTVAKIISTSDTVEPGTYEIEITGDATKSNILGKRITSVPAAMTQGGKIILNGEEVTINVGDTPNDVFDKLRDLAEKVGADLTAYGVDAGGIITTTAEAYITGADVHLKFESKQFGDDYPLTLSSDSGALLAELQLDSLTPTLGVDVQANIITTSDFAVTASISGDGNRVTVKDVDGFEMQIEAQPGAASSGAVSSIISVLDAGALTLQIGANEGQGMEVRIPNLSPKALGIDTLNMATVSGAQLALGKISAAVNRVSNIRSKLGAYQNRLEHTVNNLSVSSESMTEAMSRIQDADMAYEMAQYTQRNVIAQAGTSMLAQANQRPQSILQLLQN
ncbi:flagellin [Vallitalea pronyensis]|uniref:Flagellin n=1 Tax=Vallitalea pronyensis TaxID=1348613 RepID=A0A8J8MGM9_9FIRM|nr:flagellin [Vallitalea pronyensis]QUI21244.1 flagellin [Vallitalea pronyensis]